jgi:DNA-binding NarL/FixJ family response regulator
MGKAKVEDDLLLIVEDHAPLRTLLGEWLSRAIKGWRCASAENAEQAMHLIATARPRAVLLDIGLPDMNGIELLKRIKSAAPATTVVMLSSYDAKLYEPEARRHGASAYVHKDRMRADLLPVLSRLLGGESRPPGRTRRDPDSG